MTVIDAADEAYAASGQVMGFAETVYHAGESA
jgi:hypothetical protein